jgi:uncharacterized membrane protein YbhN (UPF0104 family)
VSELRLQSPSLEEPSLTGDQSLPPLPPRRRVHLAQWLRLLPALLLGAVLIREKPWAQNWPSVSLVSILIMVGVNFAIFLPTRVWRWRIALTSPPRFISLYASLLEGLLANAAIGFGSGDVVRAARLRGNATFTADYGATIAERGAELVAIACLLLFGVSVANLGWPGVAGACACLAVYAVGLVFGRQLLPRLKRWPRLADGLAAGISASTPRRVFGMTALSLLGWMSEIAILMVGLAAFNLPHTAGTALLVLLGINVAIVVPGPPANFGTFEAGVIAALRASGIPLDRALVFALGYHLIMSIPPALVGAIVFLARGRRR